MHERYPNLYKRARCATRLTQEGAAGLLDISVESIKQYEGGRTPLDGRAPATRHGTIATTV